MIIQHANHDRTEIPFEIGQSVYTLKVVGGSSKSTCKDCGGVGEVFLDLEQVDGKARFSCDTCRGAGFVFVSKKLAFAYEVIGVRFHRTPSVGMVIMLVLSDGSQATTVEDVRLVYANLEEAEVAAKSLP